MKKEKTNRSEILKISREKWEHLREFRKAPFQKRYCELLELEEKFYSNTKPSIFN